MRRWFWIGLVLLIAGLFAAAIVWRANRPVNVVTQDNYDRIKEGMNATQVVMIFGRTADERLGKPFIGLGGSLHSGPPPSAARAERWYSPWMYGDGKQEPHQIGVNVYYDQNGKVVHKEFWKFFEIDQPTLFEFARGQTNACARHIPRQRQKRPDQGWLDNHP